jgi:hypothetical protein
MKKLQELSENKEQTHSELSYSFGLSAIPFSAGETTLVQQYLTQHSPVSRHLGRRPPWKTTTKPAVMFAPPHWGSRNPAIGCHQPVKASAGCLVRPTVNVTRSFLPPGTS